MGTSLLLTKNDKVIANLGPYHNYLFDPSDDIRDYNYERVEEEMARVRKYLTDKIIALTSFLAGRDSEGESIPELLDELIVEVNDAAEYFEENAQIAGRIKALLDIKEQYDEGDGFALNNDFDFVSDVIHYIEQEKPSPPNYLDNFLKGKEK